MKGREAHSQLGKTGAYGETDLAVALLGFASSPGNQAALKTARVTPRSECTTGAPPHLWVDADLEVVYLLDKIMTFFLALQSKQRSAMTHLLPVFDLLS